MNQEIDVACSYAIVYRALDMEWVSLSENWLELHLYRRISDSSHHLRALSMSGEGCLFSCELLPPCELIEKAPNFVALREIDGRIFGFGFVGSQELDEKVLNFLDCLRMAVSNQQQRPRSRLVEDLSPSPELQYDLIALSSPYRKPRIRAGLSLGEMSISKPKPARKAASQNEHISDPVSVKHLSHVRFDPDTLQFTGLPKEWASEVLKEPFGIPLSQVHRVYVNKYEGAVPRVLLQMQNYLVSKGALQQEGIFRIAPDGSLFEQVKIQFENGTFIGDGDVHSIANGVKVWFRSLPEPLLAVANFDDLKHCSSVDDCKGIVATFPDPERPVFLWLLDLCADFARQSHLNKMTSQNLAIVIAPNLFNLRNVDPMTSLTISQKVVKFMHFGIEWRMSVV